MAVLGRDGTPQRENRITVPRKRERLDLPYLTTDSEGVRIDKAVMSVRGSDYIMKHPDDRLIIDLGEPEILVYDNQATPELRAWLGDFDSSTTTFGIRLYDNGGVLFLDEEGAMYPSAMRFPNDVWLKWRNQADDADINVMKVSTDDDTVIAHGTGAQVEFWGPNGEMIFDLGYPGGGATAGWAELIATNDTTGTWAAFGITEFGAGSSYLWLWTSAGTKASPSATPADRDLGYIEFGGYAPTIGLGAVGGAIAVTTTALWTSSSTPAEMSFMTTPVNDTNYYARLLIESDGTVIVSDEDPLTSWAAELKVESSALITRPGDDGWTGLAVVHQNDASQNGAGIEVYSANSVDANAPYFCASRCEGTWASKSAVDSGTRLGAYCLAGYDGSTWASQAEMRGEAPGAWSGASRPAKLEFYVTNISSTTMTLAMTIYEDTDVEIEGGLAWGGGAQIASSDDVGDPWPMANNTWATWRNAGDTADINVLSVDASDDTVLAADTGDQILLKIGTTTYLTMEADGDIVLNGTFSVTNHEIYLGTGYSIRDSSDSDHAYLPRPAADNSLLRSAGNLVVQVDSDGTSGANYFQVRHDAATYSGGTLLFEVNESGDVNIIGDINHDGSEIGFFATAPTTRQTVGNVTDNCSGITSQSIDDVSGTGDDTTINSNFADMTDYLNSLIDALQAYGLIL